MENQDWQVVVMVLMLATVQEFTAVKVVQRGVGGAMESGDIMGKDKIYKDFFVRDRFCVIVDTMVFILQDK